MKSKWILYLVFGLTAMLAGAQDKTPAAPEPPLALQATPEKPETPAPAAKTFTPTELELTRLQLAERDAELAQIALAQASASWQKSTSDFNAQIEAIKKAHNWPASVHLDSQVFQRNKELKFVDSPGAAIVRTPRAPKAPAPEEKKP